MDGNSNNLYDSLAEDAKNLRELGKSWGLDDAEIDRCFQKSLLPEKKPSRPRNRRGCCRCFGVSICGLLVLLTVCYAVVKVHKPTKLFVMRHSQDVLYPLMRNIRVASLALREFVDLSGLHELECIIPNPLFGLFEEIECWPCESVKEVQVFQNFSNFSIFYYHSGTPLVVKDANLSQVTFNKLKSTYLNNVELLRYNAHHITSNNPHIRSIGEVLTPTRTLGDFLGTEIDLYLQWRVVKAGGVRLMRNLSPKPYFVPESAEVATEMFVLLHTPNAEEYSLPWPEHPNTWLTQAYGSQKITLTPVPGCKGNCTEVSIVLEESDVLYYAPRFWQLTAFSFGDQFSIAFMGSFY